ncbi:ATP phosphoribosyltransferase regulatory subunit [Bacillus sp. OxB-1]|uniref:ATP phosphoribosyltransferase regulatory subunit n=1 Tax=Bacillus sp. (strain OxB-1) TaxID=98228 RepID=UPI00058223E3|nr:ATP phosphoribosyltransferase regulatory subunit [Bacillus sp. OxB-1]BAQ11890.1 ATP phosphoribosyltransferase regulatory subunit [Bacillus sp. OxB-1]
MYSKLISDEHEKYEQIIDTISKRFTTYGYERIKTSAFEQYDLYSKVNSSINQLEMIKVIDYTGEVLVLRPDITIPVTQELAHTIGNLSDELRYYYVQEVFRQPFEQNEKIGRTQAGIEYYCESSPEADAEVIALACHTMKDLGFADIKIEIGHAGFFNELVRNLPLKPQQISQLKTLIQAKNVVEIGPFVRNLDIDEAVKQAIEQIPFLYGNPADVSEKAKQLSLTGKMQETLDYLMDVYSILKMYGLEQYLVVDLGLINHMDYYSGIIFQGYVGRLGKPVLMGGRYDQLGNEFGATLPAIGFACEIESLVKVVPDSEQGTRYPIDVKIVYGKEQVELAIQIANELREQSMKVLSVPTDKGQSESRPSAYTVYLQQNGHELCEGDNRISFVTPAELLELLDGLKGVS